MYSTLSYLNIATLLGYPTNAGIETNRLNNLKQFDGTCELKL